MRKNRETSTMICLVLGFAVMVLAITLHEALVFKYITNQKWYINILVGILAFVEYMATFLCINIGTVPDIEKPRIENLFIALCYIGIAIIIQSLVFIAILKVPQALITDFVEIIMAFVVIRMLVIKVSE